MNRSFSCCILSYRSYTYCIPNKNYKHAYTIHRTAKLFVKNSNYSMYKYKNNIGTKQNKRIFSAQKKKNHIEFNKKDLTLSVQEYK